MRRSPDWNGNDGIDKPGAALSNHDEHMAIALNPAKNPRGTGRTDSETRRQEPEAGLYTASFASTSVSRTWHEPRSVFWTSVTRSVCRIRSRIS